MLTVAHEGAEQGHRVPKLGCSVVLRVQHSSVRVQHTFQRCSIPAHHKYFYISKIAKIIYSFSNFLRYVHPKFALNRQNALT